MFEKFIIFGAKEYGIYIKKYLEKNYFVKIQYFIDNNIELQGQTVDGIPVMSIEDGVNQAQDITGVIIAIFQIGTYRKVVSQLQKKGYHDCYLVSGGILHHINSENVLEPTLYKLGHEKPVLDYVETHVADHCNLKCRGCLHFSNMHKEQYPSIEQFKKDMNRLHELFEDIIRIRLMGGEPLLNRELEQYVTESRRLFPNADIRVVTNGLLITKIDYKLQEAMRDNNVMFDITLYPPVLAKKREIELFLKEKDIKYVISEMVGEFRKTLSRVNTNDSEKAIEICQASNCHFLREGRLTKCPLVMFLDDFNNAFGTDYNTNSSINIYDEKLNAWDIVKKLDSPIDFCNHCPDHESFQTWEISSNNWKQEEWYAD